MAAVGSVLPSYKPGVWLTDLSTSLPDYAIDTQEDEESHATFINAYLVSIGEQPVTWPNRSEDSPTATSPAEPVPTTPPLAARW